MELPRWAILLLIIIGYLVTLLAPLYDKHERPASYWVVWRIYAVAMCGCIIYLVITY
jgi:hypothetical protein